MTPVLQALILADRVYEDKSSGKKIICGTFNKVIIKRQPAPPEIEMPDGAQRRLAPGGGSPLSPYAYISLTDVCDDTELALQFVSLSKNVIIFETKLRVLCKDRLNTIEIVADLPPMGLSEAGMYAFEIVCEGEILGSHRIIAVDATEGTKHGDS